MPKSLNFNLIELTVSQHMDIINRIDNLELDCLSSRNIEEISLKLNIIAQLQRELVWIEDYFYEVSSLSTINDIKCTTSD